MKAHKIGSALFSRDISDREQFAVRLDGEEQNVFLPGTDLLVSSASNPENGDMIIARIRRTDEVLIARYMRDGNRIRLCSCIGGKVLHEWDCSESVGYMLWRLVIHEAKLDLCGGRD